MLREDRTDHNRWHFVGAVRVYRAPAPIGEGQHILAAAVDYPGDELVNRRKFLFGELIAPVGAIVAAKIPESAFSKIPKPPSGLVHHAPREIWAKDVWPELQSVKAYYGGRQWHQEELSKWLAKKVDESVFNMIIKGDLDG